MFSRLLTITWFIITIASAPLTTDINTAIPVTDPAESTVPTDTAVLPGTAGPPTSDTSAQFSVRPAQVSEDSVTSATPPGYGTMETGLTDGYSPVSSSTLTETHSASPVTHSNWVSMDVITESEHNSLASSVSPGSPSSSAVSSTIWVPLDVVTTAVYDPVVSPTSPENNATIIKSTSEYVAIETTTVRISTSPVSPSFDLSTSTPKDMASSVTVEEITDPTHDHLVSSTSSENDTDPTKTPKNVTTDPELSSGFFSASTSESNFSNPVTNHVTMETATAHISIAPSTPEETYSTAVTNTELNTMETITVSPHKTVSLLPEMISDGYGRTSFQTTMEAVTRSTNTAGVSLTKNETVPTKTPKSVTTDPELSSGFFSTSTSERNFSNPVTNHVTMETATADISIAPSTPEETYSTAVTNTALNTMETITVSPHKTVSLSPEMISDGYGRTLFQTTMEAVTRSTNTAGVSLTKNETVPTKTPKSVTTDPELSSGFFSTSTSERNFSNPVTNHVTMETATAHISIAPSTPEETYSTAVTNTALNTMETITVSPRKTVSLSPEMISDGYGRTSFQTTMEAVTRSTNTAGFSLTKNESTTSYQVTIVNVTSTIYNPGVSQTSQEDDHSSTVPFSTQVTQQEATTLVHNHTSSTSPENDYDTSVATSHHITMKTTVDMPTSTSTSLENYSTIPESTPNNNLTAFPTSENYFSTPASDYTAYVPVASSVTPTAGFSTPVGTSTETVTTSVYNPTKSTASPIDTDTTIPQGPATTQGLESTSVTESPGQGTSEMSANQSTSTPVDQTSMVMTEISVTTVAGPTGPPSDATSTMATVMSDQSTSSTVPTTTMSLSTTNTGIPEQSSSSPIVPVTGSTTAPTTTTLPVRPGGFCPSNPCPFNSVCLELITSFSCLCLAGSYFSGGRCIQARVFPGTLHIKTLEFQSEMSNRSSQAFQEMAAMISQELGEALMDQPGYLKTIVQELREGSVVASVDNIFKLSSNATKQSTIGAIHAAIQDCAGNCGLLTWAHFNATDLCKQEPAPCDLQTTNCVFQDNGTAKCICKEGYIPSLYSNTSCAACLSGERSENGKCVPCPFGYGGFSCHDSYLLAMVVISCVLGSLLLILMLAFISYCLRRSPPKSSYNSPYLSDEMSSVWPQQDVTHIPRASSIWDPTQIEMMETANADSELGSKLHGNGATESCSVVPEDMRTFKGKNSSRYSYLIQGHQNPYFIADEMKITT